MLNLLIVMSRIFRKKRLTIRSSVSFLKLKSSCTLQLGTKGKKLVDSARLEGYCLACGCVTPSPDDLFSRTQTALSSNSKVKLDICK